MMRLELFLALRFIADARAQTALIASGVGVGVAVVIFLSALIGGLQSNLIARTVGSQAHVIIEPARERPRSLRSAGPDQVIVRRRDEAEQRIRSIDGWQAIAARLESSPGITAVSPAVRGSGLAARGSANENVVIIGIDPLRFGRIVDLESRLVSGKLSVSGRDATIGSRLAAELGVSVGDVLRLTTAGGEPAIVDVRGIFELGAPTADSSWVVVSLRSAQSLLGLPGGVTTIELAVDDVFAAEAIAARARAELGVEVDSWMANNAELLTALRSQSASSWTIQVFVMTAVAIGIASVLIVSVVQRRREIGILRAMGVRRRIAQRVFLIQGAAVGLAGSVIGSGLGAALATLFRRVAVGPDGEPLFPIALEPELFLVTGAVAIGVGVLAALFPAARAARLDPVAAIRHE